MGNPHIPQSSYSHIVKKYLLVLCLATEGIELANEKFII